MRNRVRTLDSLGDHRLIKESANEDAGSRMLGFRQPGILWHDQAAYVMSAFQQQEAECTANASRDPGNKYLHGSPYLSHHL